MLLEGATILSGPAWIIRPDSSVLIKGDRIAAVSKVGAIAKSPETRIIDCRGKYLLPGFIDMHTHCLTLSAADFLAQFGPKLEGSSHREWFLRLFLAYGVTTVRDIGNYHEIMELRKTHVGGVEGPSIIAAGELMEGPEPLWPLGRKVQDAGAARKEVRRQKKAGAEWVKLYVGLGVEAAEAAIEEAHTLGLRVAGHIGKTTARQAARMGVDTLEHTLTLVDEEFLSQEDLRDLPGTGDPKYSRDRMRQMWMKADLDSEAALDLTMTLRETGTAVCPTLIVHETTMKGPDRDYQNYAYDFVPQQWLDIWDGRFEVFNPGGQPARDAADGFKKALELVGQLSSMGVPVLCGTDAALWNPYAVPGASIHREMELLVAAGMKPKTVLSSVTGLAAGVISPACDAGVVDEGKRADLVLLAGNPLEDIRRTRDIELVVNKGHAFTPEDIVENAELLK